MKKEKSFKKKIPVFIKGMKLSDIKFDKNNLPSKEDMAKRIENSNLEIQKIMSKLDLDIEKLHRPMTI